MTTALNESSSEPTVASGTSSSAAPSEAVSASATTSGRPKRRAVLEAALKTSAKKQEEPKRPSKAALKKAKLIDEAVALSKSEVKSLSDFGDLVVASTQGLREYMEDRSAALEGPARTLLLGVFDGHSGADCSAWLEERLLSKIASHEKYLDDAASAMKQTFTELDDQFVRDFGLEGAGSTATVVRLSPASPGRARLLLAWVGDSDAVLYRKRTGFAPELLTRAHHGSRADEVERIVAAGGRVTYDKFDRVYRVNEVLAVTRAIGDASLKPFVTGEPEILDLTEEIEYEDVLIIGSDGLWEKLAHSRVRELLLHAEGLERGGERVVAEAVRAGGDDNVSMLALTCVGALFKE